MSQALRIMPVLSILANLLQAIILLHMCCLSLDSKIQGSQSLALGSICTLSDWGNKTWKQKNCYEPVTALPSSQLWILQSWPWVLVPLTGTDLEQ